MKGSALGAIPPIASAALVATFVPHRLTKGRTVFLRLFVPEPPLLMLAAIKGAHPLTPYGLGRP